MRKCAVLFFLVCWGVGGYAEPTTLRTPDYETFGREDAQKYNKAAKGRMAPAYPWLADFLVDVYDLAERPGIGIDLGGGPGDLVLALADRSKSFYWIDVDVNTWFQEPFAKESLKRKLAHRTAFMFSDACALPFRDDYADFVVSRGSYQFWGDLKQGLAEVYRVLKPGGQAFIGRGLAPTMPEKKADSFRIKAGSGPKYDPDKDAEEFKQIMKELDIPEYEVLRPHKISSAVNYGVWLKMKKTAHIP